ncbi:MAG TPA: TolC family protein, partial [Thermoleophilia bacterium]|nr:TolC family protein [Thermoleophilia bacterium]
AWPSRLELGGDLRVLPGRVDTETVLAAAQRRPDVLAAEARAEQASRQLSLEEAKRVIDVSVGVGWQHVFPSGGSASGPTAELLVASLTVPLPFSRIYRGELDAAAAARQQVESQLRSTRAKAESEIGQALARFSAAAERVALFDSGVLDDARSVLEKTLYNYQRGGATIVDVLIAQRTESDVNLAYFDALSDRAHALAAVEQASGLADLVQF